MRDSCYDKSTCHMQEALHQAQWSSEEVPVGAVLVQKNKIVMASGNRVVSETDPTAHAEMLVLREGARLLKTPYLTDCDLYVTLEPCAMCAQALSLARIRRLYFGAYDPKGGGVDHGPKLFQQPTCHHVPEVYGGLLEQESRFLLKDFFRSKRHR